MSGAASRKRSGRKANGLRVEVGVGVGEPDRRRDVGAGGQLEVLGDQRLGEPAAGQRDHRAEAQRLGDRRLQVGLFAALERVAQAAELGRVTEQQVEGPGERRRRRLVPGEEQRHQLVAELLVVHRGAVLELAPSSASRGCRRAPRGRAAGGARRSRRRAPRRSRRSAPRNRRRGSRPRRRASSWSAASGSCRSRPGRRRAARRSASSRGPSVTPKTARRITSSVIACIREWIGNSRPSGQESISAATTSPTVAS